MFLASSFNKLKFKLTITGSIMAKGKDGQVSKKPISVSSSTKGESLRGFILGKGKRYREDHYNPHEKTSFNFGGKSTRGSSISEPISTGGRVGHGPRTPNR